MLITHGDRISTMVVRSSSTRVIHSGSVRFGFFNHSLNTFGNLAKSKKASNRYQLFVHSGIKAASPLKAIKRQLFLGQENFIEEIKHLLRGKERLKEVIPALNEIFKAKDKKSKDQVMYEAHLQYGYTLKDIAEYIGLYYTTVSRTIKKIEGEDEK